MIKIETEKDGKINAAICGAPDGEAFAEAEKAKDKEGEAWRNL